MSGLASIDWQLILQRLEKLATCESARHDLRGLKPLTNPEAAHQSFQVIAEAQTVLEHGQRPFMESLDLFATWYQRLEKNATLKPLELKDVRHFCIEAIALREILEPFNSKWVKEIKGRLMNAAEPLSAIDQIMTPEGDIKNDASERLYSLYREKTNLAREIQNHLDRLVKQQNLEKVLQDRYVTSREGRWVLPVISGMQHHFEGIIHASSQSKQTVFMEPREIIPQNNRLRQVEVEIDEEIDRLLRELTDYLTGLASPIEQTREAMADCDVRFAQGHLANQMQASPPEFSQGQIELREVRHPLLALNNEKVVANTVRLDETNRILLLSGPNAGGKTVLLKSIGLAAQMARCGLPICVEPGSRLPFFRRLDVGVGDSQSVDAHLSTFAAHLTVLDHATTASGLDQLLLIDEICGSTDPEEGAALARAFIETYSKNRVFSVITSHLGPLKSGWEEASGVIHGSLEYDSDTGSPTYQLIMGIPGQSLAIQTARRAGVRQEIVERALEHLSPERKRFQEQLESLDSASAELDRMKKRLQEEFKQTQKEKSKYEGLVLKFQRERENMLEQALKRAEQKVERMIEFAQVTDTFKKHETLQKVKTQLPEVIKAGPATSGGRIDTPDEFTRRYPPGSRVFVATLGRDAIVQGRPSGKGEVPILSNSMRLSVPWESLRPPQQAQNPTAEVIRKTAKYAYSPTDSDRVVDLRGLVVEEALEQLEIQLDTAALNKEERVKIIHGHGTDALKRAVRSYLSRSVYVKKWTAGSAETGGDGVTWVEITEGN
ncbi:MAG: Smr/MutS family protein [Bdellovibrionales bacterium]|nr:Smr/MutS family protein [Bdellovibrionales bacterium]